MSDPKEQILSFVLNPQITGWFATLRIIFMILSVLFAVAIIYFVRKNTFYRRLILDDASEFMNFKPVGVSNIERNWGKVMARLETGLESEYKLAVIEADTMMDDILKKMGFAGETLGDRLTKVTTATVPNLMDITKSHQIRNNIVHDPDYKLSLDQTRKTLSAYEKAFRDLQALN